MTSITVGQRIAQLIQQLGISKNAFAVSLDKTATVIQHLVEERNKPGFDLLCKMFEVYPNVSKDWLLQGQGPMLLGSEAPTPSQVKAVAESKPALQLASATPVAQSRTQPAPEPAAPATIPVTKATPVAEMPTIAEPVLASAPASGTVTAAPSAIPEVAATPVPAVPSTAPPVDSAWQTALYTQQMAHQLAMAELRNQHLQEQQRLMQQMMELMQKQLGR